ncbi:MAG: methionyl-tRNA formyltransferase [Alphaproteobacteria bacterium]|nr:methionyl-tRNA formyltransferase [Alphaproteobacteria bacterium]
MKLILMGTNDFVVPVFDALAKQHEIIGVFTRAPKPMGRKHVLTPSPVHTWAEQLGLKLHTSIKEFDSVTEKPDYIVVMSYGVILRDNVLNAAKCINIHPSSLPKYRGPSPIRTAILNGDTNIDVCLMAMTAEMDAGDVYLRKNIEVEENDTNADVENKVSAAAIEVLNEYLASPDSFVAVPQDGEPTFTRKFTGEDEIIDWSKDVKDIHNQIRALGCGRTKINGIDVKILETRIVDGKLCVTTLQPAGKNPMDWKSFLNGLHGVEIRYGE